MAALFSKRTPFDRALIIRHLSLCASTLLAYALREELRVGNSVLWILAVVALVNFQAALFWDRPVIGVIVRLLSPTFGLAGWIALMLLTGGVTSPFTAGLWLEITLSAMTGASAALALVTAGSVLGLWLQQIPLGLTGVVHTLTVQTAFLLVTSGLAGYLARRSRKAQDDLSLRHAELRLRLEQLENEMEEARTLGKVGENVARLAHGLKNAVHSLRGLLRLIESSFADSTRDRGILHGLNAAVDRMEEVARVALGSRPEPSTPAVCVNEVEMRRVVSDVAREVGLSFPGIRWCVATGDSLPEAKASPLMLREVLTILVRNAAEAMRGQGELEVGARQNGPNLEVYVRDHGPGIASENMARIFEPGFTTKTDGNGFGLFLARRVVQSQGGSLRVIAAEGGGTVVSMALPASGLPMET